MAIDVFQFGVLLLQHGNASNGRGREGEFYSWVCTW